METGNNTFVLSYLFCYLINFHENGTDYSPTDDIYVKCPVISKFYAGDNVGKTVSIFLWVLILIVGTVGVFGNCIIIVILRKQYSTKPFQILITLLAMFDLLCCAISMVSASGLISYFKGWNRGCEILHLIYISYFTTLLGRTGSTFTKVFIAMERLIFISNPDKVGIWLTKWRTRLVAIAVIAIAIILTLPRYLSVSVWNQNNSLNNVPSIEALNLDWLMLKQPQGDQNWFTAIKQTFQYVDYCVPLPVLVILMVLIHLEIKKITCEKRELQVTRKKDIREVQMFIPIIIILFLCNILPIASFLTMKYTGIIYREHLLGSILFYSINSAANLPIYCWKASAFRKESRAMLYKIRNHPIDDTDPNETAMTSIL